MSAGTPKKYFVKSNLESEDDDLPLKRTSKGLEDNMKDMSLGTPLRRGKRPRKLKNYADFFQSDSAPRKTPVLTSENESSNDEDGFPLSASKPSTLFTNDDIEGQRMFHFKANRRKTALFNKANEAVLNSPNVSTPTTPRRSLLKGTVTEATPRHIREKMKKKIIHEVQSDESNGDFSASSSDFEPDDESSENENSDASAQSSSEEEVVREAPKKLLRQPLTRKNLRNRTSKNDTEYILKSDDYFNMNSGKKIITSDHTLERLKNNNIADDHYSNYKFEKYLTPEHKEGLEQLNSNNELLFDKWLFALEQKFSVLLYGLGSKRFLLQKFQKEKLNEAPVLVVNGFFPSLTIRNVFESIIIDLLEIDYVPSDVGDCIQIIDKKLKEYETSLYLIIHNIDGPMLHGSKTQNALANLSALDSVKTVATIDHINAPLMWDHSKQSKFKWIWFDVTTLLPYQAETSYENSLLSRRPGALQLSSLKSVYASLTSNSKGIFNIIIKFQLENSKTAHYQGLPFKDLYSMSREQFLVSSDIALRAQLTEFLDHKLVKMKRSIDGSDNLVIPIDNMLLQQFLAQQE